MIKIASIAALSLAVSTAAFAQSAAKKKSRNSRQLEHRDQLVQAKRLRSEGQ